MSLFFREDDIKKAFWLTFHKSGRIVFPYVGSEEAVKAATEIEWAKFLDFLKYQPPPKK